MNMDISQRDNDSIESKHVFRNKNTELLDVVEANGQEFYIPATPGWERACKYPYGFCWCAQRKIKRDY